MLVKRDRQDTCGRTNRGHRGMPAGPARSVRGADTPLAAGRVLPGAPPDGESGRRSRCRPGDLYPALALHQVLPRRGEVLDVAVQGDLERGDHEPAEAGAAATRVPAGERGVAG